MSVVATWPDICVLSTDSLWPAVMDGSLLLSISLHFPEHAFIVPLMHLKLSQEHHSRSVTSSTCDYCRQSMGLRQLYMWHFRNFSTHAGFNLIRCSDWFFFCIVYPMPYEIYICVSRLLQVGENVIGVFWPWNIIFKYQLMIGISRICLR